MDLITDYPARVAAVVKDAMDAAKITRHGLAIATGIPRETLRRRLDVDDSRSRTPSPGFNAAELAAIAPHIGMKVSDIYLAAEARAA